VDQSTFKIIEHTADIGIEVIGARLADLFIHAAEAMFSLIASRKTGVSTRRTARTIPIHLEAADSEELFIAWLNELLSLSAVKNVIFSDFRIDTIDDTHLKGSVRGEPVARYRITTEIKAATFHELALEHRGSSWKAKVIFDV
jgi:SHS2 domain-containing protein